MKVVCSCIFDFVMSKEDEQKVKSYMEEWEVSVREAVINLYRNNEITLVVDTKLDLKDMPIDEILEVY